MIDFPIIDSHIHLLDRTKFGYSWSSGSSWATGAPKLNRDWTSDDLASYVKPYQVEGFVFVEADVDMPGHIAEAEWVDSEAINDTRIMASVACVPLEKGPSIEPEIARIASFQSVRGVRRLVQNLSHPSVATQRDFREALNLLPSYGLSFDVCVSQDQLPVAIEMMRQSPRVAFVLDHIGMPDIKSNRFEHWEAQIREIATFENVVCKLSGVLTQATHSAWTYDEVLPYIELAIQSFGTDRILFGGDWPVLELAASYREWVDVVDKATGSLAHVDRRKIFRDNAIKTYRLAASVESTPY
jgi:L-fuconolactonase